MDDLWFKWDYLSLWFEVEPEVFGQYLATLEQLGTGLVGGKLWQANTKVKALGQAPGGKRRYVWNAWGIAANVVHLLPWAWRTFVRRIDIKAWPGDLTGEVADKLAWQLVNNENPYNITTYNSRPRRKDDKRDAGGKGFAVGSHKSDLRVSVYSRAGADYCLEYQCRGDMLRRILDNAPVAQREHDTVYWSWQAIKDDITRVGHARYARALAAAGIGEYVPTTLDERIAAAEDTFDNTRTKIEEMAQRELDLAALDADTPHPSE